jgi:hypothetical protein
MNAFYTPEFEAVYEALKRGDGSRAENAVAFLEADPVCFRSGYAKADLLRFLGRIPLGAALEERLRSVVLQVVRSRHGREFRRYCLLARQLDCPDFRRRLALLRVCDDPAARLRAKWVIDAMNGPAGRRSAE